MTMRVRTFALTVLALCLLLLAGACAGEDALDESAEPTGAGEEEATDGEAAGGEEATDGEAAGGTVIVGSANFTEQLILANMYAELLESRGVTVERRLNLGSREIIFPALESGEIGLLPEYNGAVVAFLTGGEADVTEPEEVTEALRAELPEGLVALEPSDAQDKDGLAVLPETAEEFGLETYSDLAPVAGEMVVGGPAEMEERDVGLPGLEEVYGIEFAEFRALDAGGPLTSSALSSGDIDVGRVFTTQGVIDAEGWVVLEDDMNLAPAQNIIPIIREDVLTSDIEEALNELSALLTTEDLVALNARVDVDAEDPEIVAVEYLEENGLTE
jgi:osmoprotectant transport system substrate-binding protein